jgi:hypothetical protein
MGSTAERRPGDDERPVRAESGRIALSRETSVRYDPGQPDMSKQTAADSIDAVERRRDMSGAAGSMLRRKP